MSLAVVWHASYEVDIGPHVFPTAKYRLVRARLLAQHTLMAADFIAPEPASHDDVLLVHTRDYVEKILAGRLSVAEQLLLEVPFSAELREAMWRCAGGSIRTAHLALEDGIAVHLGGGFHHAFADHGEGFCLINDVAIAIRALQRDGALERALVLDCDVHHGNGTASIFAADPTVFTMSIHQDHNYPAWKPPSDFDLALRDQTADAEYQALLERHVPEIVQQHAPDLAFYLAGADPYAEDQLGGLRLTIEGLRRRDEFVLEALRAAHVPTAIVLAGGYARQPDDTVEIHCNTVRAARMVSLGDPGA
jgi:acetoin utilization deacetylase AcuC-like enzyme